jgi:hypothetical protein
MTRILSISIAVWTLLVAPSLCQTGVLLHDCYGSTCGHEATCDSDPCSETVIKASVSRLDSMAQIAMIASAFELAPPAAVAIAPISVAQTDFHNPPSPQFKLPLLV